MFNTYLRIERGEYFWGAALREVLKKYGNFKPSVKKVVEGETSPVWIPRPQTLLVFSCLIQDRYI